jgi:membrane fusion protein, heavy metal efflux system
MTAPILPTGPEFDSKLPRLRLATMLVLVVVGGILGTVVYRDYADVSAQTRASDSEKQLMVREGNRITLPAGSPLRGKLAIDAVGQKDIQQTLALPAVVEADPGHLAKVLPPLAGRITEVKVQLGERVESGQALAVLDSPDLAAAYADYDRAKVLLTLATQNRDRLRDLSKIGGAAIKDLQQTETDYVTADVEFQRAAAHLQQIGVEAETTNKARTVTVTAPISGSVIDLGVAPRRLLERSHRTVDDHRRSHDHLGHRQCARDEHGACDERPISQCGLPGLSERSLQGRGAVRQRRTRSRHAPD